MLSPPADVMPTETPSSPASSSPVFVALRILGVVVLTLMVVTIVYAGWIAIDNWGTIRV